MVTFKYIEDLFKGEDARLMPSFDVCEGTPQMFTLMRLQCKFNLVYDEVKGPIVDDDVHRQLCRQAIKLAKIQNVDVFITPEYSIPISTIDEIVEDTTDEMKPSKRKIWILCCEGCELTKFKSKLDSWEKLGVIVIRDALESMVPNNFVDALLYIFKLEDDTLCLIPQLKTNPMSDRMLECEERGMSQGRVVFRVGKDKVNQLSTIICADALDMREICLNKIFERGNEELIILHPQMNPKPRYDAFSNLRHTLYSSKDGDNLVYITANCATGTLIKSSDLSSSETIKNPWSCIYLKNSNHNWLEVQRKTRKDNLNKGMNYGYLGKFKLDVWYSIKEESIQIVKIIKPKAVVPSVNSVSVSVLVDKLYKPSEDGLSWNKIDKYLYQNDISELIAADKVEYSYPLNAGKEERDKFFGLCFGDTELGELAIDKDEICELVSMHVDEECEEKRIDRLNNYPKLIECLNNSKLPKEFGVLIDNHEFTLKDNIFNLISNNINTDARKIIVAYANNEREARQIEGRFKELIGDRVGYAAKHGLLEELDDLVHGSNMINYCIFTIQNKTANIITYPQFDNKIMAKSRVENISSIKRVK